MSPRARSSTYRLIVIGLVLWAAAATASVALRLTFGRRPAYIHVRWAPTVDDATRQRVERLHGLVLPELEEGRTFSYALTDIDRENIRSLVLDPAAEDTHYLHRTAFRVGYFAPRLPYATPYPAIPAGLELVAFLCFLGGLTSVGLACLVVIAPNLVRGRVLLVRDAFLEPRTAWRASQAHAASWIAGRIPVASAEAVAVFRIAFGGLLLHLVLKRPVSAAMAVDPSNAISSTHQLMLQVFIYAPRVADWLPVWLALWGTLFIVGAFARTAFTCLSIGVLGWAALYTTSTSYHTVSSLLLSLLALQGSRWGDAWSVDAWRRTQPARPATSKHYGYVTWAPALVLGLTYFAAAFAKIRDAGLGWILNGTVKYHFLSDSPQAAVDWGLQLGHYPTLAIVLSFAAIAVEALIIVGVAAGAYRYRLAAGIGALGLLGGFYLLQGLFWTAWWILLLSFLPWHLVRPGTEDTLSQGTSAPRPSRQPRLAVALVVALLGQQCVVSLLRIEASPVLSSYDMYSTTYGSPADYERSAGQAYWIVGFDGAAETHRCRISQTDADAIERSGFSGDRSLTERLLRRCLDASIPLQQVFVEATRVQVDWMHWRLLDEPVRTRLTEPMAIDLLR